MSIHYYPEQIPVYGVGDVLVSADSTDPGVRFGYGTWTRVEGKFIVGLDESDPDFDTVLETGGSKTHTHN